VFVIWTDVEDTARSDQRSEESAVPHGEQQVCGVSKMPELSFASLRLTSGVALHRVLGKGSSRSFFNLCTAVRALDCVHHCVTVVLCWLGPGRSQWPRNSPLRRPRSPPLRRPRSPPPQHPRSPPLRRPHQAH
jgi:hypothetical protein